MDVSKQVVYLSNYQIGLWNASLASIINVTGAYWPYMRVFYNLAIYLLK
jgi:hypothetical protein